ncbi:MAG TPA: phosphoribosyltransferase [Thermodesulfobacteriaceae bacterium]|nr:phosphoribosyltransferase [Thermodesulfobacteriaceae bacterium]
MNENLAVEFISWNTVWKLSKRLAALVREDGFRPHIVAAIARGGYVPARLVCDCLDIYDLTSFRIAHYTGGATMEDTARLSFPLQMDIKGKNVLVVDDVTDTGDTVALALEHIQGLAPAECRVGVLHHKRISTVEPDYFARKVVKWRWLVYPWAVVEDVTGFIHRLARRPVSVVEASGMLANELGIEIPEKILRDVLAIMGQKNG